MLRLVDNARWVKLSESEGLGFPYAFMVGDVQIGSRGKDHYEYLMEKQALVPVCMPSYDHDLDLPDDPFWQYKDRFFFTDEEPLDGAELKERAEKILQSETLKQTDRPTAPRGERIGISRDLKVAVWERDEGKCRYCGSTMLLQFDHVIPIAKGGSNSMGNLQLLCDDCNRKKGAEL